MASSENEDPTVKELEKEKARLVAEKAKLDAEKALAESQTQGLLAKIFGSTKEGPYKGNVELKDKGGVLEAKLLAAHAIREAAEKLVEDLLKNDRGGSSPNSIRGEDSDESSETAGNGNGIQRTYFLFEDASFTNFQATV